jgi:hypothetical protein
MVSAGPRPEAGGEDGKRPCRNPGLLSSVPESAAESVGVARSRSPAGRGVGLGRQPGPRRPVPGLRGVAGDAAPWSRAGASWLSLVPKGSPFPPDFSKCMRGFIIDPLWPSSSWGWQCLWISGVFLHSQASASPLQLTAPRSNICPSCILNTRSILTVVFQGAWMAVLKGRGFGLLHLTREEGRWELSFLKCVASPASIFPDLLGNPLD